MLTTATPAVCVPARTPVADMTGTWWVAQTCPLKERRVVQELRAAGVDCFLPIEHLRRRRPDRQTEWRHTERLLFPSYVFVNGDAEARYQAARLRKLIAQVINVPVPQQAKLGRQLADIELTLLAGESTRSFDGLAVGRRVRVTDGPLMGIEGTLERRDDRCEVFVLGIDLLGQGIELSISPSLLELA